MKPSRRLLFYVWPASAAVVCITVALTLANRVKTGAAASQAAITVVPKTSLIEAGSLPDAEVAPESARLMFVPPGAVALRLATLSDFAAEESSGENPDAWSAETRIDAALVAPETAPQAPAPAPPVVQPRVPAVPQRLEAALPVPAQVPASVDGMLRPASLKDRLAEISPAASKRLTEKFAAVQASWPPAEMALVAIKAKKVVELHARAKGGAWTFIHRYPVLAASGMAGPKLRQGDKQVPEGIYGISSLNPNSRYHVSMRVSYPNAFDRQMAAKDGRADLGGDIMIHGKAVSIGCLAVGDAASEELFVLAAQVGTSNVSVIIAPADFRRGGVPPPAPGEPAWLPQLYAQLATTMAKFEAPPESAFPAGLLSFFEK